MSHHAGITWLKFSSILLIVLGALFSWGTVWPLAEINLAVIDFVVLPMDGAQSFAATETRLLTAISGGVTAGMGMAFYMMAVHVYATDQHVGGRMILTTAFTWFFIDSFGSILAGAAFNVVPNAFFLAMIVLPVYLTTNETKTSLA